MYEDLSADEYRILGLDERHSPVIVGPCEVEVAAAADGTAAAAEADSIDEEQDERARDMMDAFDVLAGGQPEGPGGAVLDEVGDAVAWAMGLDPDDFDAAELCEILEILAPGR